VSSTSLGKPVEDLLVAFDVRAHHRHELLVALYPFDLGLQGLEDQRVDAYARARATISAVSASSSGIRTVVGLRVMTS